MECTILDDGGYTFERTYKKPMERGKDIYVNIWNNGYVFLVNNPDCAVIQITDQSGIHNVPISPEQLPFMHCTNGLPQMYRFLDKDGNELS